MVVDEPEENNVDKMPEIVEHPATPQIEKNEGNDDIVPIKSPDGIRKEESKFLLIFNLFSKVTKFCKLPSQITFRKVASSNTSRLGAHAGFFRLFMKGIFDPYVL